MRLTFACVLGSAILSAPCGAQNVFSNNAPITIPSSGNGIPYPSTIGVAGLSPSGPITNVVVTLTGLSHPRVSDLDIVLVGPAGQHCILRSDAGGDITGDSVSVTFSRTGRSVLQGAALPSGTFAPVNFGGTLEDFPAPGPGLVSNTDLAVFDSASAVGTWSLFLIDDSSGPSSTQGTLAGWTLRFNDPIVSAAQPATEFSYQGLLKVGGVPFTGEADLRFSLWNDASSAAPGSQFGAAIERAAVPVTGGIFTTLLDFGAGAFSEKRRFLQVEFRVAPDIGFTPVLPRTPLTGAPFAGTTPLARAANQLDAPDGTPAKSVEVDNSGLVLVNSSLNVAGLITSGTGATLNGPLIANAGISIPPTQRLRAFPATGWRPASSSTAFNSVAGDWIAGATAGAAVTFHMPLDLPDGAIIRSVVLLCEDVATTTSVAGSLRRIFTTGAATATVAAGVSTGGVSPVPLLGLNEAVDSNTRAYTVVASWTVPAVPNQVRIGSVLVTYDITSPLP